ncbi:hypothetical protein Tco_0544052 [Tanacetum coccineum]
MGCLPPREELWREAGSDRVLDDGIWVANWVWCSPRGRAIDEVTSLNNFIGNLIPHPRHQDGWVWSLDNGGIFTVNKLLKLIDKSILDTNVRSGSPEPRRGRSESPKKKGPERKSMFKRLENGVFHRLGDKGKSVSVHSDDSRRWSHHSSRRNTESCHQSSRSRATESASGRRYNKRASSRKTEEFSESESSAGGHWKSKLKRQKSSIEDDLSQPWVCEETDPFTPRIRYFDFPKTRIPSHIKTYNGSEDLEDHLKIF